MLDADQTPNLFGLTAIAAVFGSIIGSYLTHRLTRSRARNELIREKVERLVEALFEHMDWRFSRVKEMLILQKAPTNWSAPLDIAIMLQLLYFPELGEDILSVKEADKKVVDHIAELAAIMHADPANWDYHNNSAILNDLRSALNKSIYETIPKAREIISTHIDNPSLLAYLRHTAEELQRFPR